MTYSTISGLTPLLTTFEEDDLLQNAHTFIKSLINNSEETIEALRDEVNELETRISQLEHENNPSTKLKFGIFNYLKSGHYHARSCLQWFNSRSEAQSRANRMMKVQDGLNIVVMTFNNDLKQL